MGSFIDARYSALLSAREAGEPAGLYEVPGGWDVVLKSEAQEPKGEGLVLVVTPGGKSWTGWPREGVDAAFPCDCGVLITSGECCCCCVCTFDLEDGRPHDFGSESEPAQCSECGASLRRKGD